MSVAKRPASNSAIVRPTIKRSKQMIRVGSDCTGINAARVALESLGLDFEEKFASEKDVATRTVLKHNFGLTDHQIYDDVCCRNNAKAPSVDVYTAGFPCQSYSSEGLGQGLESQNGLVGLACIMYIVEKKPRVFLLENVSSLANARHWEAFSLIMNTLYSIKNKQSKPFYRLTWNVVDALDCGVPQSRPRLFIVGLATERRKFAWPPKVPVASLDLYLNAQVSSPPEIPTTMTEQRNYLACVEYIGGTGNSLTANFVADLASGFDNQRPNIRLGYTPCLTRSHIASNSFYSFARRRKLVTAEYFRLQGFPTTRIVVPDGISDRQIRQMIGNSFCVTVVACILDRLLFAAGLTDALMGFSVGVGEAGNAWPCDPPRRAKSLGD